MAVRMQWRVYATINYEIHLIHKKSSGDPYAVFTFIYTEAVMCYIFAAELLFSGELLLYTVLNIEVINVEVFSKQVKSCLKYTLRS